ncbi:hypothetical protein ACTFR8_24555 [Bacillus cereus group sp. MYBK15-3]|uniref:hypothetical protein n=1 Tax=unclassified Bacillus cereus group TaxID=2750818 RepID=UPI003F7B1FAA
MKKVIVKCEKCNGKGYTGTGFTPRGNQYRDVCKHCRGEGEHPAYVEDAEVVERPKEV